MKKLEILFGLLRIPMDAITVALALIVAYHLRVASVDLIPWVQLLDPPQSLPPLQEYLNFFAVPGICIFLGVAAFLRLYSFRGTESGWREVGEMIAATALWLVLIVGWYFFVRKELFYSRILLLHSTIFIGLFVSLGRAILTFIFRACLRAGYGVRAVLTYGLPAAESVVLSLKGEIGYRYLGHARTLEELRALRKNREIDLVLETCPNPKNEETLNVIEYCRSRHIEYAFLPPVFADSPHLLKVERLGLLPLVRFQPTPLDGWGRVWKRVFDIIVSAVMLILLSPFFLVIALLTLLDSGWPIFYLSKRVGQYGKTRIPVIKFRSMVTDADARKAELLEKNHRRDGPLFKMKNDPRVTRVGRVIRHWSIDELPQLWNVFLGQMSLVGPRPHLLDEVQLYEDRERRVFAVKPGITGLAQVSGRSDLSFADEVRLDLQYIEEWSILLDIWILWRTLFAVAGRKGAD